VTADAVFVNIVVIEFLPGPCFSLSNRLDEGEAVSPADDVCDESSLNIRTHA
jgi:hypothetical protein